MVLKYLQKSAYIAMVLKYFTEVSIHSYGVKVFTEVSIHSYGVKVFFLTKLKLTFPTLLICISLNRSKINEY